MNDKNLWEEKNLTEQKKNYYNNTESVHLDSIEKIMIDSIKNDLNGTTKRKMKNDNYGIYKIVNKNNGKYYVGRTLNLNRRWHQHKNLLLKNKHFNKHLQFAWNKYGEKNFEFIIVEHVDNKEELINTEQKYIDEIINERKNGINNCYNLSENANSPMDINKGRKHSDKTKRLLSKINKGRIPWNRIKN